MLISAKSIFYDSLNWSKNQALCFIFTLLSMLNKKKKTASASLLPSILFQLVKVFLTINKVN